MIIEAIKDFIKTCPYLEEFEGGIRINVNYLDGESVMYSIEEIPTEQVLKQYINGDSLRQLQFTFCSRESYSADVLQNIANSKFYEDFANWVEEQNDNENLPLLANKFEATEIKVLTNGYAVQVSEDTARYQIDLRLKYMKRK
ncbi:chloramphenicol resistance protein [Clostridium cellulovorans]|uniref:Chloramphenicol resistance protein n=1 Tax=Clostridium cellulovorans (strain ATCC 35296 / DSM 3052 / OCM 3 / 743B) TaxID=573061 RepID=D9SV28_CLOC7|nr:chloramphenicol resistance protein [Clostridium cellulovorans]ADL53213.1 hypothetical protein Clocel_3537 [Clostridium cellulovorans 743B]